MKVHTARAEAVCTRAAAPSSRAQTSATGWAKRAQKEEWKVAGEVVRSRSARLSRAYLARTRPGPVSTSR